jgi:hypothetical protein
MKYSPLALQCGGWARVKPLGYSASTEEADPKATGQVSRAVPRKRRRVIIAAVLRLCYLQRQEYVDDNGKGGHHSHV